MKLFYALLLLLAIFWAGLHTNWRRPGETAVLRASVASGDAREPISAVFPQGDVAVNSATAEALCKLYGVGISLANAIIEEREQNGNFFFPEDLLAVKGIGTKKLADMREQIRLE